MRRMSIPIVLLALASLGAAAAPTRAAPSRDSAARAAAMCRALEGRALDALDAPTRITTAQPVPGSDRLPAFCRVQATIEPDVGIEIRLPILTWNGKFLEYGRGGYCRPVQMQDCDTPLRKGYACVISDMGHKSNEPDDIWAYENTQAKVDCGFRGAHVAASAGKAITAAYFGVDPAHSYYMGCSTGGRLGLLEAQRFPWDFDGIIAGAAPITKSADGLALMWNVSATLGRQGTPILAPADIRLIAQAALAECDLDDGLKDGVIGDPRHCHFDPRVLQCNGVKNSRCLTRDQVDSVRKIYAGPVNSQGERLYEGSALPGSELNWIGTYVPADAGASIGGASAVHDAMTAMFRYMNTPERGAGWSITQFDWDRDYRRLSLMEAFNGAANPDLRRFKAAGGKLIVYHGLADEAVMPENMIAYYELTERTMGGEAEMDDFFKLYLVPGMNHCSGGAGANVVDYIAALEDWVERGHAPEALTAAHLRTPRATGFEPEPLPVDPANVDFTRPLYPYPLRTRYSGSGDPTDAKSFIAVGPDRTPPPQ